MAALPRARRGARGDASVSTNVIFAGRRNDGARDVAIGGLPSMFGVLREWPCDAHRATPVRRGRQLIRRRPTWMLGLTGGRDVLRGHAGPGLITDSRISIYDAGGGARSQHGIPGASGSLVPNRQFALTLQSSSFAAPTSTRSSPS